jgi:hypothetical protein
MGTTERAPFSTAGRKPDPLTDTGAQLAALDHLAHIAHEQSSDRRASGPGQGYRGRHPYRHHQVPEDPWSE